MAKTNKTQITPEELFTHAISENRSELSEADLRLLISGLTALREASTKPLNKIELNAVRGMVAYVAYTQGADEAMVASVLAAHYSTDKIEDLPSRCYPNIIEFLVDLNMDNLVN
ncbi:MAG TPA: hypothetical protein DD400_03575 [Rhodospirillaceae bacterium]|nr:hypothetical protein [Rhodospirillaceae bacterium]